MIKKILISGLLSVCVASSLSAAEPKAVESKVVKPKAVELKEGMNAMSGSLYDLQRSLLTNDKKVALSATKKLRTQLDSVIGNEKTIKALLPEEVKHKSSIAINSAHLIEKAITKIEKTLNDRTMNAINKQMRTQKAYLAIQTQCFRCHNLVRDW